MNLESTAEFEKSLVQERDAFQQNADPFKGLLMSGCKDLHLMQMLSPKRDKGVWQERIWNCQDSGCGNSSCLSLCRELCPKPNVISQISHTYPSGTNNQIVINGRNMGAYLMEDRKYEDELGNQVYVWKMGFEAFDFETDRMHQLYAALDSEELNVMKIITAGLADSIHIIDCGNDDPTAWTFEWKGWTSDQATKAIDARGKRLVDVLIDISAEHTMDAYQWVKLTGEPSYARLSRTFDGERLDYTRVIAPLGDERLAVFTRHEEVSWTKVH